MELEHNSIACDSSALCCALSERLEWIKKASEIVHTSFSDRICSVSYAEEVLAKCQVHKS